MNRCTLPIVAGLALGCLPVSMTSGQTLTDLVVESGGEFDSDIFDYDILLNAVLAVKGTAEALADPDVDYTLFAPNDLAFIRLARDLEYDGFDEQGAWEYIEAAVPNDLLGQVLLYHVSPESLRAWELIFLTIFDETIPTLQGATIEPYFIKLRDNEPDFRDPIVFWPFNVPADNGILHTIGRVLIPIDLP